MTTKDNQSHLPAISEKRKRGGRRSTSWPKGVSGNPKGAPKRGLSLKDLLADFAERETPEEFRSLGSTWREAIIHKVFLRAAEGNVAILRELLERSDASSANLAADAETVRELIDSELRRRAAKETRSRLEALRGDPELQKRVLELEAAKLDLESQIAQLISAGSGDEENEKPIESPIDPTS